MICGSINWFILAKNRFSKYPFDSYAYLFEGRGHAQMLILRRLCAYDMNGKSPVPRNFYHFTIITLFLYRLSYITWTSVIGHYVLPLREMLTNFKNLSAVYNRNFKLLVHFLKDSNLSVTDVINAILDVAVHQH